MIHEMSWSKCRNISGNISVVEIRFATEVFGFRSNFTSVHIKYLVIIIPIVVTEIVQTNQEYITKLVEYTKNGKSDTWRTRRPISNIVNLGKNGESVPVYCKTTETISYAPFWTQFVVLLQRMMLQQRRNKLCIGILVLHHAISTLLFAGLFYNIGNNGLHAHFIFSFTICVMVFFVFTYVMMPVLLFPAEAILVKREYCNRWYGLKAYYLALMLRNLPLMMILGLLFLGITYLMTNQPMELTRFVFFASSGLLVGIASEGIGTLVGTLCRITNGAIVAPGILSPMLLLSFHGIGYVYNNIVLPVKIAMSLDYMRFGGVALLLALLEDREPLECSEAFCMFQDPNFFLREMGVFGITYASRILGLIGFTIVFKVLGYFALMYRLNPELLGSD